MAAGLFKIKEILPSGLPGVIFHWTADERPPVDDVHESVKVGARACPLGDWNQPGEMRSTRTEYVGNPVPSEQVQGSAHRPQEFAGRWDDRYNFKGFAQDTLREFRALCERGNLVEVAFQSKGYIGLLKTWNFAEKRDWFVGYMFTLSIHGTIEQVQAADLGLAGFIEKSPLAYRDDVEDVVAGMVLTDEIAPRSHMVDGPADAVSGSMSNLETGLDSLDDTLDQRDLNVSAPTNPISPFSLLGSKFRTLTDSALDIFDDTIALKSDANLAVVTGKSVLDFEDWSRSMRFHARTLLGSSLVAEEDMKSRASPDVDRLYSAREGESLMAISREVYGSPHQWGIIYSANGLTTEVLEEPMVLIIPQLGSA